jgi:hypothetical protein
MTAERTFTITFVPRRNIDGARAVRRLLKYAGRYLGLRALDVREEHDAAAGDVNTTPAATAQRPADHFAPRGDDDV